MFEFEVWLILMMFTDFGMLDLIFFSSFLVGLSVQHSIAAAPPAIAACSGLLDPSAPNRVGAVRK